MFQRSGEIFPKKAAEEASPQEADKERLREVTDRVIEVLQRSAEKGEGPAQLEERLLKEKERYIKSYRDRFLNRLRGRRRSQRSFQEIEALFGLPLMVLDEAKVKPDQKSGKKEADEEDAEFTGEELAERKEIFRNLTSYQYLVTDHLIRNADDRTYLKSFWASVREISDQIPPQKHMIQTPSGRRRMIERSGRSIVGSYIVGWRSQAAAFHILHELGLDPDLAVPEDDAFRGIDSFCTSPKQAGRIGIQVKTASWRETNVPLLTDVERSPYYYYPSTGRRGKGGELIFSQTKVYPITSLTLHIPSKSSNSVTAKPKPAAIKACRVQLRELGIID